MSPGRTQWNRNGGGQNFWGIAKGGKITGKHNTSKVFVASMFFVKTYLNLFFNCLHYFHAHLWTVAQPSFKSTPHHCHPGKKKHENHWESFDFLDLRSWCVFWELPRNFLLVNGEITLHPGKVTCPLKWDYFNRKDIFQPLTFRGHVSFRALRASQLVLYQVAPFTSWFRKMFSFFVGLEEHFLEKANTPWKFKLALENEPSQKESNLPTIILQGRAVKLRGCIQFMWKKETQIIVLTLEISRWEKWCLSDNY